jgi:hypothetical protein
LERMPTTGRFSFPPDDEGPGLHNLKRIGGRHEHLRK